MTTKTPAAPRPKKPVSASTVGRGKTVHLDGEPTVSAHVQDGVSLFLGDSLGFYDAWDAPTTIVSDGAYGILGFEGDTTDHLGIQAWYEQHIAAWSRRATAQTTLWFWNSEIGWATVHPLLEKHGWRYVNANVWDKGLAHIAGNVNTAKIRRFPVVSEICVHYVFDPRVNGVPVQRWLHQEWKRTGLPMREANTACGVKDAATRKYLDQGHLWYCPPASVFHQMATYANLHGDPAGVPYFSRDGQRPMNEAEWEAMRSVFHCPHGVTNVWQRNPLKGSERIKVPADLKRAAHLNQKPLDLMARIIEASSNAGDVVWEPFGGLFSASLAARKTGRRAFAAEIDPAYFQLGVGRFQG